MKRTRRLVVLVATLVLLPLTGAFAQGAGGGEVDMMWLTWVGSLAALAFALYQAISVLRKDPGTQAMKEISRAVQEGAMAYLKQQYSVVGLVFVILFILLGVLSYGLRLISPFVPFAFITGGFFSGLAGFIGMSIATRANCRTAAAAKNSLNSGLRVAFSAGTVMGMTVVGLGLLDLSIWWTLLRYAFHLPVGEIPPIMITFGMGASSMALFARVGGGIFTKAADVGADLVGKVESGIPEDDPRNPAVIADNVGDNVGDVAGMGADLYESYVGSIVATMALGAIGSLAIPAVSQLQAIQVPISIATIGVICFDCRQHSSSAPSETCRPADASRALRRGRVRVQRSIAVMSYFLVWYTSDRPSSGLRRHHDRPDRGQPDRLLPPSTTHPRATARSDLGRHSTTGSGDRHHRRPVTGHGVGGCSASSSCR